MNLEQAEKLSIGDEVIWCASYYKEILPISRLTKSQIFVSRNTGELAFWKKNGKRVGNGERRREDRIFICTPEKKQKILDEQEKTRAINVIKGFANGSSIYSYPKDELVKIAEMIKEGIK